MSSTIDRATILATTIASVEASAKAARDQLARELAVPALVGMAFAVATVRGDSALTQDGNAVRLAYLRTGTVGITFWSKENARRIARAWNGSEGSADQDRVVVMHRHDLLRARIASAEKFLGDLRAMQAAA